MNGHYIILLLDDCAAEGCGSLLQRKNWTLDQRLSKIRKIGFDPDPWFSQKKRISQKMVLLGIIWEHTGFCPPV